jgi:hypothetical protein
VKLATRWFALFVSMLLPQALNAGGSQEGMGFTDLTAIDKNALSLRLFAAPRVQVATELPLNLASLRQNTSTAFGAPLARVAVDAAALLPRERQTFSLLDSKVVSLAIEGARFDFALVESTFDPSYDVQHIAGVLLSAVDGRARFTVRASDSVVFGTIYVGGRSWRLTPAEGGAGHVLRSITPRASPARNDSAVSLGPGALSDLESRHVQMLRIAEVHPTRFHTHTDGSLVAITGGAIEQLNLANALRPGVGQAFEINQPALAAQISAALTRLQPMTRQPLAAIEIHSATIVGGGPGDLIVRVNEVVDGIPVEPAGLVAINTTNGNVEDFSLQLTGAKGLDRSTWMDESLAATYAQSGLTSAGHGARVQVVAAKLQLTRSPNGLQPQWLLSYAPGTPYVAVVDAISGETQLVTTVDKQTQAICESNGQNIIACASTPNGTPGTWRVSDRWSPRFGEGVPYPTSGVPQRYRDVFNTVEEFESFRQSAGPPNYPVWQKVDVTLDNPGGGVRYDNTTSTVLLPPAGHEQYLPGVDPASPAAKQGLFHELMHHSQNVNGGPGYTVANNVIVLGSLKEGLADAGAALATGRDWVLYDGIHSFSRDLTSPKSLADYNTLGAVHEKGLVFGNMIYRISGKLGVSEQAIRNLVFETYSRMDAGRAGEPSTYDIADIYETMIVAATGNTPLTNAIGEVWVEMGGPPSNDPGQGSPNGNFPALPGGPSPPSYIDGVAMSCSGPNRNHYIFWMNTPGAIYYETYFDLMSGGGYQYMGTAYSNSAIMLTGYFAKISVRACNWAGCSWMSNDYYFAVPGPC